MAISCLLRTHFTAELTYMEWVSLVLQRPQMRMPSRPATLKFKSWHPGSFLMSEPCADHEVRYGCGVSANGFFRKPKPPVINRLGETVQVSVTAQERACVVLPPSLMPTFHRRSLGSLNEAPNLFPPI